VRLIGWRNERGRWRGTDRGEKVGRQTSEQIGVGRGREKEREREGTASEVERTGSSERGWERGREGEGERGRGREGGRWWGGVV
jgi:hypothetical protein